MSARARAATALAFSLAFISGCVVLRPVSRTEGVRVETIGGNGNDESKSTEVVVASERPNEHIVAFHRDPLDAVPCTGELPPDYRSHPAPPWLAVPANGRALLVPTRWLSSDGSARHLRLSLVAADERRCVELPPAGALDRADQTLSAGVSARLLVPARAPSGFGPEVQLTPRFGRRFGTTRASLQIPFGGLACTSGCPTDAFPWWVRLGAGAAVETYLSIGKDVAVLELGYEVAISGPIPERRGKTEPAETSYRATSHGPTLSARWMWRTGRWLGEGYGRSAWGPEVFASYREQGGDRTWPRAVMVGVGWAVEGTP